MLTECDLSTKEIGHLKCNELTKTQEMRSEENINAATPPPPHLFDTSHENCLIQHYWKERFLPYSSFVGKAY